MYVCYILAVNFYLPNNIYRKVHQEDDFTESDGENRMLIQAPFASYSIRVPTAKIAGYAAIVSKD